MHMNKSLAWLFTHAQADKMGPKTKIYEHFEGVYTVFS